MHFYFGFWLSGYGWILVVSLTLVKWIQLDNCFYFDFGQMDTVAYAIIILLLLLLCLHEYSRICTLTLAFVERIWSDNCFYFDLG